MVAHTTRSVRYSQVPYTTYLRLDFVPGKSRVTTESKILFHVYMRTCFAREASRLAIPPMTRLVHLTCRPSSRPSIRCVSIGQYFLQNYHPTQL
jgi:hypothetical protein